MSRRLAPGGLFAVLALSLLASCASSPTPAPAAGSKGDSAAPAPFAPVPPKPEKFDWIRLKSGEWLKGDITVLREESLTFDSDELDELTLDWEDIVELRSPRLNSVLIDDGKRGTPATGRLEIDRETVTVRGEETLKFDRKKLLAIVPGEISEKNYWAGKISFGFAARSGNVNQVDVSSHAYVRRSTLDSRLEAVYHAAYGQLEGEDTADNQRLNAKYDVFIGRKWYVTPLAAEYYRDRFKNIDHQVMPAVFVGYHAIDRPKLEWDVIGGVGYRYTKFDSVETGEDSTSSTTALIVGTVFDWDITKDIELHFDYNVQMGVPDTSDTNHHAFLSFSIDLAGDLDLDLSFTWDRVGQPAREEDGTLPENDDVRYSIGVGWEF